MEFPKYPKALRMLENHRNCSHTIFAIFANISAKRSSIMCFVGCNAI